jgi:glycosyltransferase involved in cell wall biosynthesis
MGAPDAGGKAEDPVRVIAFYLPQFHRIPENDAWWGEGFTEWTNVRRARPNFAGHWQPHVPGELGYYDLTDPAVREAQAALARAHGIDAFCYYHYWFGGKRLLERPFAEVLASGRPDFPFCLCWANENWTRRWDGQDHEILMPQRYAPGDALRLIEEVIPAFRDPRYVRVGGRPLFLVYNIAEIPDVASWVAAWRTECVRQGVGDPYLCAVQRQAGQDPTPQGFDAAVEFPPIGHSAENITGRVNSLSPAFRGTIFGYRNLATHFLMQPRPAFTQFRGVTPMWDNTARRQDDGMILADTTPEAFGIWMERALRQTRLRHSGDRRLLFVNAWNEWAEGNHLEPDERHGRRYLDAALAARRVEREPPMRRPSLADMDADVREALGAGTLALSRLGATATRDGDVGISVVMPLYNHARFLARAFASLTAQTRLPSELVVVDDGSTDDSARVVEALAGNAPFAVTLAVQRNAGADRALNRGIAIARGTTIALVNSDDAFAPRRLEVLCAALREGVDLAFSDVELVDDDDRPAEGEYARVLRSWIAATGDGPDMLRTLVRQNVATSTGNLVFRRALLAHTGGFAPMAVCHDWDFVLAASYATRFAFVREQLYRYRLHDANTFAGRPLAGREEGEQVVTGFLEGIGRHPWLDDASRAEFLVFARAAGLAGYLPREFRG